MLFEDAYRGVLAYVTGTSDVRYVQMAFSLSIQHGVVVTFLGQDRFLDRAIVGVSSGNAVTLALQARSNDVIFGQISKFPR